MRVGRSEQWNRRRGWIMEQRGQNQCLRMSNTLQVEADSVLGDYNAGVSAYCRFGVDLLKFSLFDRVKMWLVDKINRILSFHIKKWVFSHSEYQSIKVVLSFELSYYCFRTKNVSESFWDKKQSNFMILLYSKLPIIKVKNPKDSITICLRANDSHL